MSFPGGSEVKNPSAIAGDTGSIPGSRRSPGEGNGNVLQDSCLGNPVNRGTWWTTVHEPKNWTQQWLNNKGTLYCMWKPSSPSALKLTVNVIVIGY